MNPVEELLTSARAEQAAPELSARIIGTRHRKKVARRLAILSSVAGGAVITAALFPKPAYAGFEQSVAKTLNAPLVRVHQWTKSNGKVTNVLNWVYGGTSQRLENDRFVMLDDGKRSVEYLKTENHVFYDRSREHVQKTKSMAELIQPGWNIRYFNPNARYNGKPANSFRATKTYHYNKKKYTSEMSVFAEPNQGRLLLVELWDEGHNTGLFWEYSYPKPDADVFALNVPPGTAQTNLQDLRDALKQKAAEAPGGFSLLGAYRSVDGTIIAVTKGGAGPRVDQPQNMWINGVPVGSGNTYAFGFDTAAPPCLKALGSDVWFQSVGPRNNKLAMGDTADLTVYSWKQEGGKRVPDQKVTFKNVRIPLIPNGGRLLWEFARPPKKSR